MQSAASSSSSSTSASGQITGLAEKARIQKLAEQIHLRLMHAQQVKLSGQQSVNPQVRYVYHPARIPVGHVQGHVTQAEEIQRRLTEAVLRLQEAARGEGLMHLHIPYFTYSLSPEPQYNHTMYFTYGILSLWDIQPTFD